MRRKSDILQEKRSRFSIYLNFNMESNGGCNKNFRIFSYRHQNSSSSAINKAVFENIPNWFMRSHDLHDNRLKGFVFLHAQRNYNESCVIITLKFSGLGTENIEILILSSCDI